MLAVQDGPPELPDTAPLVPVLPPLLLPAAELDPVVALELEPVELELVDPVVLDDELPVVEVLELLPAVAEDALDDAALLEDEDDEVETLAVITSVWVMDGRPPTWAVSTRAGFAALASKENVVELAPPGIVTPVTGSPEQPEPA
jgi:hypothetical protein